MMLARVISVRQRGGLATTSAYRAAHRHLVSAQGPTRGLADGAAGGAGGSSAGASAAAPASAGSPAANMSKSEILAARQARKAGSAGTKGKGGVAGVGRRGDKAAASSRKLGSGAKVVLAVAGGGVLTVVAWQQKRDMFNGTILERAVGWITDWVAQMAKPFTDPSSEKLLPDWPLPQLPPDTPCPPLLVLDLEGTLLGTIFDRKNGWRSAKRPGLDDFLKEMHQLYEIAVFTDNPGADEWINKMDPNGYISYRLFRDATKFIDGKHVKDLTHLNRPIEKIVIVDDNADAFSLQPENGIHVKKYSLEDGSDPSDDTVLPDLAPFLRALATQDVSDFRKILAPYIGQDSSAIVANFRSRIAAVRNREEEERNRGLGGLVRTLGPASALAAGSAPVRRAAVTSKDIVGEAPDTLPPGLGAGAGNPGSIPLAEEKRGGLFRMLDEGAKEREEELRRKSEVFQRVMQKREERERARREEQKKAKKGG